MVKNENFLNQFHGRYLPIRVLLTCEGIIVTPPSSGVMVLLWCCRSSKKWWFYSRGQGILFLPYGQVQFNKLK